MVSKIVKISALGHPIGQVMTTRSEWANIPKDKQSFIELFAYRTSQLASVVVSVPAIHRFHESKSTIGAIESSDKYGKRVSLQF